MSHAPLFLTHTCNILGIGFCIYLHTVMSGCTEKGMLDETRIFLAVFNLEGCKPGTVKYQVCWKAIVYTKASNM
jgi:hypothetical protein